jgi:hypothetical protein
VTGEVYQEFGLRNGADKLKEKLAQLEAGKFGPAPKLVSQDPPSTDPVAPPQAEKLAAMRSELEVQAKRRGLTVEQLLEQSHASELPPGWTN